jgi:hypothetical protein
LYGKDNLVDFRAFKDYLFKPIAKGQDSVFGVLRKEGVIDGDEALRFNTLLNRIITNQKAIPDATVGPLDRPLVRGTQAFVDLIGRLVGSKIGTSVAEMIPGRGQGIIEASAGVRSVLGFLNVPASKTQELFLRAAQDPVFFKMLVTKAANEKEALVLARRVRAYILDSGLGFLSSEAEKQITGEESGVPPLPRQFDPKFLPGVTGSIEERSSVQPNQQGSPTTQIGQGLNSGVNNRLAANVGTPPPAASIDRNRFASLFPNDPISGLINAQQPTQFMQYGGVAGDPSYDMGLETAPVSVQEAIQSALEDTGSNDDYTPRPGVRLPSSIKTRPQGRRPTGITSINLPGYANTIVNELRNFVTKYKPSISVPQGGGIQFGITKTFQDGGFVDDLEGDPSDYGMTQDDFDTATSIGQATFSGNEDNIAQATANAIAQPQIGQNRSNIIGLVDAQGRNMYDPQYAAALDIRAGLDPTNNFGGIGGLTVPSYLRPQIQGEFDSEADMVRPMFYSGAEKFLVQDAPKLVKRGMNMGIMGIFSKLFGQVGNLLSPQQVKRSDTQ